MNAIQHGHSITTDSYYDGVLVSSKLEDEISILSSPTTMLKDVINTLDVITQGKTNKLTITVIIDSKGNYRIVKKWNII